MSRLAVPWCRTVVTSWPSTASCAPIPQSSIAILILSLVVLLYLERTPPSRLKPDMEAWAALSIATNIITVADAGLELIVKGNEVYNSVSGATAENEALRQHEWHLRDAVTELLDMIKQPPGYSITLSQDDIALCDTAQRCALAGKELNTLLTSLQRQYV